MDKWQRQAVFAKVTEVNQDTLVQKSLVTRRNNIAANDLVSLMEKEELMPPTLGIVKPAINPTAHFLLYGQQYPQRKVLSTPFASQDLVANETEIAVANLNNIMYGEDKEKAATFSPSSLNYRLLMDPYKKMRELQDKTGTTLILDKGRNTSRYLGKSESLTQLEPHRLTKQINSPKEHPPAQANNDPSSSKISSIKKSNNKRKKSSLPSIEHLPVMSLAKIDELSKKSQENQQKLMMRFHQTRQVSHVQQKVVRPQLNQQLYYTNPIPNAGSFDSLEVNRQLWGQVITPAPAPPLQGIKRESATAYFGPNEVTSPGLEKVSSNYPVPPFSSQPRQDPSGDRNVHQYYNMSQLLKAVDRERENAGLTEQGRFSSSPSDIVVVQPNAKRQRLD